MRTKGVELFLYLQLGAKLIIFNYFVVGIHFSARKMANVIYETAM